VAISASSLAIRLAILAILAAYVSVSISIPLSGTTVHSSIAHTATASAAILTPTRRLTLHSIKGLSSLLILSSCTSS
jgi:hypothetical protein